MWQIQNLFTKAGIDAETANLKAWLEARERAEAKKPEEIDVRGLMPLFVPAELCSPVWCGPIYRLSNPDVALTWGILMEGNVLSYLNRQQVAYWESQSIDWMAQAYRNLKERTERERGAKPLVNKSGQMIAMMFRSSDGLGSSRLLLANALEQWFPKGYRVALPDRNLGFAFGVDVTDQELQPVRLAIDKWSGQGPNRLAAGIYPAKDLLPVSYTERSKLLHSIQRRIKQSPAIEAVMEPHRRGDYEAALQATEGLRQDGEITAPYCFYRGAFLAHLGRIEEAEEWLRRAIAMRGGEGAKRHLSISLTMMGELMLRAGRFGEAQECFEKSMEEALERGSGYRNMALLCLLRGDNPPEAVNWAKHATEKDQADSVASPELQNTNLGEDLATLAWAIATDSRDAAEVARLAGEAVSKVSACSVEARASVQYCLGRAYTALNNREVATSHYEEAAKIDIQGHWGRIARAALEDR